MKKVFSSKSLTLVILWYNFITALKKLQGSQAWDEGGKAHVLQQYRRKLEFTVQGNGGLYYISTEHLILDQDWPRKDRHKILMILIVLKGQHR